MSNKKYSKEFKLCWKGWIGILSLALVMVISALATAEVDPVVLAIPVAISIIIQTMFCFKLAKAFGKGLFMGLVLMFTAGLGRIILGFGKSQYVGNPA